MEALKQTMSELEIALTKVRPYSLDKLGGPDHY